MKDKLPASISGQIGTLRSSLNAAKSLGGRRRAGGEASKLPGLGQ